MSNETSKPDLTLVDMTPRDDLPTESLDDFKHWVLKDNMKPSDAIHKLLKNMIVQTFMF